MSTEDAGSAGFDLKAVEAEIAATEFAGHVMHFPSVGSTNTLALEAAQAGARGGVWVADEQTAGRGRGGHGWHSVIGDGLYVSALVAPSLPMTTALLLSLATGLAAKAAIAEVTGLDCDIRWPNDLMMNERKCGGILVETAVTAESNAAAMLRYAVIGVGMNLNHERFSPELETVATSLRMELGARVSRERLLPALLRRLDDEIRALGASGEDVLQRFAAASSWVRGKRVRVEEGGGYTGVTNGLDSRGFLRVVGDDGVERTVLSGGVREI
jgi:BirA family biotin operon repressor/biotin-[acetyl-CoA-carboxylase] ligase